jgi:hypothetical protein
MARSEVANREDVHSPITIRHSPDPNSGAECVARTSFHVVVSASEAIQFCSAALDCFVATLLAMTRYMGEATPRSPRRPPLPATVSLRNRDGEKYPFAFVHKQH